MHICSSKKRQKSLSASVTITRDGIRHMNSIVQQILVISLITSLTTFNNVFVVHAGIQQFNLKLMPSNLFVHYNSGYIRSPGSIDLSGLTFSTVTENNNNNNDNNRLLDGGNEQDSTDIDIAIFSLPSNCSRSKDGCDWVELGIGARTTASISDTEGTSTNVNNSTSAVRWCCSDDAIELGLCTGTDDSTYGRLIINHTKFNGNFRYVSVPDIGDMNKRIRYGFIPFNTSATYVVLYANCNIKNGRTVIISGQSIWKSIHGYLPGEYYGFMYFYTIITIFYFLLFFWYGTLMHIYDNYRIDIEKYILFAITLGLLEMIFRTGDFFVWNTDGVRSTFIIWIGILSGVLKQGISRCLLVMVALGLGVIRDTLGRTINYIILLGIAYVVTSIISDIVTVYEIEAINEMSTNEEHELLDFIEIITLISSLIDSIFIVWILDALNNTIQYLETMNQARKLQRFLQLRLLFLFSVLFAIFWTVFALVDKYGNNTTTAAGSSSGSSGGGIVNEEHAWTVQGAVEINYLAVLIGIAYLWRPNEYAQQYAYVMEIPSNNNDDDNYNNNNDDEYTHELEMSATVPSALDDDDDNDNDNKNGFHDESPKEIRRFEIS